ncbi:unnamed protein product, partial [Choristocarpus tenellus]
KQQVVPVRKVHPKWMFGSGKTSELHGLIEAANADAIFINGSLSGAQHKALQQRWDGALVLDRFMVILQIFAERARTTEAKLQVELASLKQQVALLVSSSSGRVSGYDRQRGNLGAVGGSGEKDLETKRRLLRDRITDVTKKLESVKRRREMHRRGRYQRQEPSVALVGYTNVGKSSLLNHLSKRSGARSQVDANDRLFDTLDPTVRAITLPSLARCVMCQMVDTVGFIRDLPLAMVHAFRATLDEVRHADLILHVRDASAEVRVSDEQKIAVMSILDQIGASDIPILDVWNKIDKHASTTTKDQEKTQTEMTGDSTKVEREMEVLQDLDKGRYHQIGAPFNICGKSQININGAICVSAKKGLGMQALLKRIDSMLYFDDGAPFALPPREKLNYVRALPRRQQT